MAIVKVLSRHTPSYGSLLRYILNEAKVRKEEIFRQNLHDTDIPGLVGQFVENESFRRNPRNDQIFLYHEMVSFSAKEDASHISREVIGDLVREYIRLRGETGVLLGAVHRDREHVHVHFCVSAVHFRTGKAFGLAKEQLLDLKMQFQRYHLKQYPELSESAPAHEKGERYMGNEQWHARHRQEIAATAQKCFARAHSQQEFLSLLRDNGLHYYERNGRPIGVEIEGKKYTFKQLLPDRQFDSLKKDVKEEEQALSKIREARTRQQARDVKNRDIEDRAR